MNKETSLKNLEDDMGSRFTGIHFDEAEFKKMAKRRLRRDLGKYLRRGTIPTGVKGNRIFTIPMDWFEIPSFRYGFPKIGIGQGEGEPGEDLGPSNDRDRDGKGKEPGTSGGGPLVVDIELSLEEFTELFQETLNLPKIKPKGERSVQEERDKWNTFSRVGPLSRLDPIRTFDEALRRSISEGTFKPPDSVVVVPQPDDFWFKSWQTKKEPKNNAVILFVRDISGSMGIEETRAAQYLCGLCSFWLSRNYDDLEEVYIVHHGEGWETKKEEFFSLRSEGGTEASSGHKIAYKIINERFSPDSWNIYIIYLSDGLNFSSDNDIYIDIITKKILPIVNQYNYGEIGQERSWLDAYNASGSSVFSDWGTIGELLKKIEADNIAIANIVPGEDNYDSVIEAIKEFFKEGR